MVHGWTVAMIEEKLLNKAFLLAAANAGMTPQQLVNAVYDAEEQEKQKKKKREAREAPRKRYTLPYKHWGRFPDNKKVGSFADFMLTEHPDLSEAQLRMLDGISDDDTVRDLKDRSEWSLFNSVITSYRTLYDKAHPNSPHTRKNSKKR